MPKFHIGTVSRYTSASRNCSIVRSMSRHESREAASSAWPVMSLYLDSMFRPATEGRSVLKRSSVVTATSSSCSRIASRSALDTRPVLDASPRGVLITCSSFVPISATPFRPSDPLGGEYCRGLWKGDGTLSTVDVVSPESICRQAEGDSLSPAIRYPDRRGDDRSDRWSYCDGRPS